MEHNKDIYQKTFSRLTASAELKENILAATEQMHKPKKFLLRRVLVVAAAAALLFALAMGASAAIGGDLFLFSPGNLERVIPMDGGMAAYVYRSGEKVSVIVQEAPAEAAVLHTITMEEPIPVNSTPDPNAHTIIKLSPPKDGESGESQVRLISIKVIPSGENQNTQIDAASSGEPGAAANDGEEWTHSIVYGNTISIQVITSEDGKNETFEIVDNSTDGGEEDSITVKVELPGGEKSADGGGQPVIEVKSD